VVVKAQGDTWSERFGRFARAIRDGDEEIVQQAVIRVSQSRRWLAPLAWAVGGLVMLFYGVKLLFSNWRLTLVQVLPAMWIWLALYDLKAHVLYGNSFHILRGAVLIPIGLVIVAITIASFFLNAVFGFAIIQSGVPEVRPAVAQARAHLAVILGSGAVVGAALAVVTTVVTRAQRPWFAVSLSVVIGVMMLCYVAVPARLIGAKPAASRRDRLAASAVSGAIGVIVCTPPYLLGRVGILMLGVKALFIPGLVVVAFAATFQAGATGAVKAVKMSVKFMGGAARAAVGDSPATQPADVPSPASSRPEDQVAAGRSETATGRRR
jgi:hypothetical protein